MKGRKHLARARRAQAVAFAACLSLLAIPSTAGAGDSNITAAQNDPVGNLVHNTVTTVNDTVGNVTSTVNQTVTDVTGTVDDTVGNVTGGGAPTVPNPPAVPHVSVPDPTPASGNSGNASPASSAPSTPSTGSSSSTPSSKGGSSTSRSSSSSAAKRRVKKLSRTPAGRRKLRAERTAAKRRAAAKKPAVKKKVTAKTTPVALKTAPKDDNSGIPHTLEKVVEVVPTPIRWIIGLLLALVVVLFGRGQLIARRAKGLDRQREQLLQDVGLLQEALLPEIPQKLGELETSVAYRPADGPAAGGDFYDVFLLDDERVAIIVGDVSGHGRGALARTALMRYTLRAYLDAGLEPRRALKVAGRALDDDLGGDFATVVVAVHDPSHATLTYSSAGHPPPIVTGTGPFEPVTALSSPPIGAGLPTGQRQTTIHLPADATCCFFTDGLVEAKKGGDLVGREKLHEMVEELNGSASADKLLAAIAEFADETPDDMAACIVKPDKRAMRDEVPGRIEEVELSADELKNDRVERFLEACGVTGDAAASAMKSVASSVGEFGGALLRVRIDEVGTRCEVESTAGLAEPMEFLPAARIAV